MPRVLPEAAEPLELKNSPWKICNGGVEKHRFFFCAGGNRWKESCEKERERKRKMYVVNRNVWVVHESWEQRTISTTLTKRRTFENIRKVCILIFNLLNVWINARSISTRKRAREGSSETCKDSRANRLRSLQIRVEREKKKSLVLKRKKRVSTWMTINEIYRHIVLPN